MRTDLSNGRGRSNEVSEEGVMEDVEVCNEAAVHDETPLEVVHHTEPGAKAHDDIHPVEQTCMPAAAIVAEHSHSTNVTHTS